MWRIEGFGTVIKAKYIPEIRNIEPRGISGLGFWFSSGCVLTFMTGGALFILHAALSLAVYALTGFVFLIGYAISRLRGNRKGVVRGARAILTYRDDRTGKLRNVVIKEEKLAEDHYVNYSYSDSCVLVMRIIFYPIYAVFMAKELDKIDPSTKLPQCYCLPHKIFFSKYSDPSGYAGLSVALDLFLTEPSSAPNRWIVEQSGELERRNNHQAALQQRRRREEEEKKRAAAREQQRLAMEIANREASIRSAKAAMERRLAALRFDNWQVHPQETMIFILPKEWAPFKMIGLAYANVIPLGSTPPAQSWNNREKRFETWGAQLPSVRSLYLSGIATRMSITARISLSPHVLPDTQSEDLLQFIVLDDGEVLYAANPYKRDKIGPTRTEEETLRKVELITPFLNKLYERAISSSENHDTWS